MIKRFLVLALIILTSSLSVFAISKPTVSKPTIKMPTAPTKPKISTPTVKAPTVNQVVKTGIVLNAINSTNKKSVATKASYYDINVLSPIKINVYNKGKVTTYIKKSATYNSIITEIQNSFQKEFNTLRLDNPKDYVEKSKIETGGIELIYGGYVTTSFPTFRNKHISAKFKSIFIPIDQNDTMFIYETVNGYTTAPIYLKKVNNLKSYIN